jgi:hypothetical protein
VQEIVKTETMKIFENLGIDKKYIYTEAKEMYDNLKTIENGRDTEKNPSMALTEILNIRFRLLKFFQQSLVDGKPDSVEGKITEITTFELTAEQMAARDRGEQPRIAPTAQSIEVRKTIKGTTPAMPGENCVSEDYGSGGDSGSGSA